jgi:hypothetical protein
MPSVCCSPPQSAFKPTRVALVIGNGAYGSGALANPVNDAQLLRDTLQGDGFAVTYLANADPGPDGAGHPGARPAAKVYSPGDVGRLLPSMTVSTQFRGVVMLVQNSIRFCAP